MDTFHNQDVQSQLYYPGEKMWIQHCLHKQVRSLGIWQVSNYIKALEDKAMGGQGMVHTVTFDN